LQDGRAGTALTATTLSAQPGRAGLGTVRSGWVEVAAEAEVAGSAPRAASKSGAAAQAPSTHRFIMQGTAFRATGIIIHAASRRPTGTIGKTRRMAALRLRW